MITELAEIEVKPGEEKAFEAAVAEAVTLFKRSKGCRGMELQRGVEKPSHYRLVVKWETLDDHIVHFRSSAEFQEWRRLVSPYFASAPSVEHMRLAVAGF